MQLTTSDIIAVVGAVFAFLAVIVSYLAWRYPRRPAAVDYPTFRADIFNGTEPTFIAFLEENDRKITRLFGTPAAKAAVVLPMRCQAAIGLG